MPAILRLLDLVTSDALTLTAACVLAFAVLALLLVIAWPSSEPRPTTSASRSTTARTLAASGTSSLDIARKTGLSRDALALVLSSRGKGARQLSPHPVRLSLFSRLRGVFTPSANRSQVAA